MEREILVKEKEKLSETLKIVEQVLLSERKDLDDLFKNFIGSREELWKIANRKKVHISNLETSLDKPYFARIDFTSDIDGENHVIYIGKNGVIKGTDIVVTDWRAPISSLYYDAEVGQCSYKAPDGIVSGNMELKRQFEIKNGNLEEYFDVNLVSNDSLLQKYLNSNNDARLRSIVATIQKEQNDVIRKDLVNNLIIQGVAGSGKTTVALHRIAYLVYNYINTIKQSQYLVIGPNPVFLKYIRTVLPDLDVDGVEQCTFENFTKSYIEEDIKINSSDQKVVESISGKRSTDIDKFKCSAKYQKMIEQFLKLYFYGITSKSLMLGNFEVIPRSVLQEVFQKTESSFSNSLNNRIELTIERLSRYIENENANILARYSDYSYELFKEAKTSEERAAMRNMFIKDRAEISKNCRGLLRKYFNKSKISSTKMYKLFLSSISDFDIYNYENLHELKKETLKNIKGNTYDFEDLAALIYIKSIIAPNRQYDKIKHVVIDEAQDFGEFNFLSLKRALPSATFSIFGDLAQSIYDYRSIGSWDEVNLAMFDNTGEVVKFTKSYRTTAEIMDVADDIAEDIGLSRSDLVVRHGEKVKVTEISSKCDMSKYIANKIQEYKSRGYKSIAIISKTDELSNHINNELAKLGFDIPNVGVNDDLSDKKFQICTISNQLAKGLEFDAVIINDASEDVYSSDSSLDMKLLYVAVTRALHELDVLYSGELTEPLKKHKSNKQLVKAKI